MEIKFEFPQMIKATNPQPITMRVRSRELLEAKKGLIDIDRISQLPYDKFEKEDNIKCQPIKK